MHFDLPDISEPNRLGCGLRLLGLQPGLTHVTVDNLDEVPEAVPRFGGRVRAQSNIGVGMFIDDPDGQLIELSPAPAGR